MPKSPQPRKHKHHKALNRPPFDCIALLLQGGGALGAYQAGVYEALAEADLHPDWVAGISIGALNATIIAGNPAKDRVAKLREFWETITALPTAKLTGEIGPFMSRGESVRTFFNQASATLAMLGGAAGFFAPRLPPPFLQPDGTIEATSYYDTSDLKGTLERLADFERINAGDMRLSVGTVNVSSGNFVYFDSTDSQIRPEHVMASGALPPGFPAIEIEGEFYWDGGLVSNTPLQWVVYSEPRVDTLAFQIDLWSARGELPRNLGEVETRRKEIQFSSRTRAGTDQFKQMQRMRGALASLLTKLPKKLQEGEEARLLKQAAGRKVYNIVHLIYRTKHYEGNSKDYEFSRLSMEEHWRSGYNDTVRTLRHPEVLERPKNIEGVATFDLTRDGRE
jgi:NTE family protein